jgi:hypothetical protein
MQQTDLSSVDIRVNVELLKIPIIADRKICQARRFHIQWLNLKSSVQVPYMYVMHANHNFLFGCFIIGRWVVEGPCA